MFQKKRQRSPLSPDFYDGYYKFKEIWRQEGSQGTSACGAMHYLEKHPHE